MKFPRLGHSFQKICRARQLNTLSLRHLSFHMVFLSPKVPFTQWSFRTMVLSHNGPFTQWSFRTMVLSHNCHFAQWSFHTMVLSHNGPFAQWSFLTVVLSHTVVFPFFTVFLAHSGSFFSFRDKLSFRRKESPAMKSKFSHGGGVGQISAPPTPEVPRRNSSG